MRRELSNYLDLLRVTAALAVFLGHLSWEKLSGGFLWPLQKLGHDGVIVFFVLSGFVIQYVVTQKEKNLYDYAVARLGRLYSVVLPALLLTVLCDALGQAIQPDFYDLDQRTQPWLRVAASALFLSQSWGWHLTTLSNTAFWSLPYEFWYYQIFGAALFLRGRQRIFWVMLGCLVAGPAILIYLPIWLFGSVAFLASQKTSLGKPHAWVLFTTTATGIVGLLLAEQSGMILRENTTYLPPSFSPVDFFTGILVALNIYAAAFISLPLRAVGKPIAYLAGFTFGLYLFHMPLLYLAATITPESWSVPARGLTLGAFTLAAVFALSWVSERRKAEYARGAAGLINRLRPRPAG